MNIMNDTYHKLRYLVLASQRYGNQVLSQAFTDLGVTTSQAEVLSVIFNYKKVNLNQIGQNLVCENGSPSRLVNSLVKKQLIHKNIDQEDKRFAYYSLNSKGLEVAKKIIQIENEFYKFLAQRISVKEAEIINKSLEKLLQNTLHHENVKRKLAQ
jgi:MarR family transcriptional regulator, organic hydroperoxide resistance regulator